MKEKPTRKRPQFKAPKGWMTAAQVMDAWGISHSTLYRIYPDIFSELETIPFHGKRIFKEERVNNYLKEKLCE